MIPTVRTVIAQTVNGTLSSDVGRLWGGLPGLAVDMALGLICGMGCAAVFWLIAGTGASAGRASERDERPA